MKKIATAFALCALSLLLDHSTSQAQQQKPSAEYSAIWDVAQGRWKDTIQTFKMSYSPEYTLTSKTPKYQTTYSGYMPIKGDVYQSRFFWEPRLTHSMVRIDSIHENGTLTPVRLDLYDRTTPGRTAYTRSTWNGTDWKPIQTSVSMTDTLGVLRSAVNHSMIAGELTLTDSTHVDVTQDMKGNVLSAKLSQWTKQDPILQVIAEQKYTLAGDGSISIAEIWNTSSGDLAPALRVHSIDWAVRNKSFSYIQREQSSQLLYGGDGYRSAIVDLATGGEWTEIYQLSQTFDALNRVTSYAYDVFSRDTVAFEDSLISLNQHDDYNGSSWATNKGTKTIFDRDANGTLRSVTTQRFDPLTSMYVNDRHYYYTFGTADVNPTASNTTISIYPNPVTQTLTINSAEPVITASVISATGAVLLESAGEKLDVQALMPGAYGIRVQTSRGEETLKFVKVQ